MTSINQPLTDQLIGKQVPLPEKSSGSARVDGLPCFYELKETDEASAAEIIRVNGSKLTLNAIPESAVDPGKFISFRVTD